MLASVESHRVSDSQVMETDGDTTGKRKREAQPEEEVKLLKGAIDPNDFSCDAPQASHLPGAVHADSIVSYNQRCVALYVLPLVKLFSSHAFVSSVPRAGPFGACPVATAPISRSASFATEAAELSPATAWTASSNPSS
jgi:hypothetical protein